MPRGGHRPRGRDRARRAPPCAQRPGTHPPDPAQPPVKRGQAHAKPATSGSRSALAAPPRRGRTLAGSGSPSRIAAPACPPERKADLFEPFAEMEPAGQRRPGGTGLGLAICRRLVELLGGSIGIVGARGRRRGVLVRPAARRGDLGA
ncbi:MAG: ATP-binding protein [Acetobacteraceae bacterium]|nr:ATP-binding protein [Acetobacteraceae bacterium]